MSQCDCRSGDITRMGTIIQDKLRSSAAGGGEFAVTALSLLRVLVDVFMELSRIDISSHMNKLSSKLVMCLCHAELLNVSVSKFKFLSNSSHRSLELSTNKRYLSVNDVSCYIC